MVNQSPDGSTAIRLWIAGVTVRLLSADPAVPLSLPARYAPFVAHAPADLTVRVHRPPAFDLQLERLLFAMPGYWEIGYWQGQHVIRRYDQERRPSHVLVFDPQQAVGDVYWLEGVRQPDHDYALKYPLDMLLYTYLLLSRQGIVLHAAAAAWEGQGLLFLGSSGSGKSTMAGLWQAQPGSTILNDDRVILRQLGAGPRIYGTPWPLKGKLAAPDSAPLQGIFFLQHAPQNQLRRLGVMESVTRLLANSLPTYWDSGGIQTTLALMEGLVQHIPCYELGFVPDARVVDFIRCQLS